METNVNKEKILTTPIYGALEPYACKKKMFHSVTRQKNLISFPFYKYIINKNK